MSITEPPKNAVQPSPLTLKELAAVLVRHYDLHEGEFDLLVEFQIGVGAVGPDPAAPSPGAMIGVSKVGLMPAHAKGPSTVDAAQINPKPRRRGKARSGTP